MIYATEHQSTHFMVLPEPKFWNSPSSQNFQVSFSGVALIDNFKGNDNGSWNRDTLSLSTWHMRMDKIIERVKPVLPALPAGSNGWAFIPLQWIVYATVNSQFDQDHSVNAGFAADNFRIKRITTPANESGTQRVNIFDGMYVDLAVRDRDARIYRVGYSINVYGYFAGIYIPPIE